MGRFVSVAALAASLLLAACAEEPQRALAPSEPPSFSTSGPACSLSSSSFGGVFQNPGARAAALAQFDSMLVALSPSPSGPDTATARVHAMRLVDLAIHSYRADSVVGGHSAAARALATDFINGVLCIVGLPTTFSPDALSDDGAAGVVTPDGPPTTLVTETGFAGVQVPSGAVTEPVVVTVVRLPDTPGALLPQLDQYPIYYEFHVTPEGALASPAVVGVCLGGGVTPPDLGRLRVAHNVAPFTMESIEILPVEPAPFLDCSNAAQALAPAGRRWIDFARAGFRRVGPALASVFGPARLEAASLYATSGVGGTTRNFSPFGLVDTLVQMTANSPTAQTALAGSAVAAPPSVTLRTPNGHLFSGLPVNFAITSGGGSVTAASTSTDLSGVATLGSWTLGGTPGPNTVNATATPPHPGSGILSSPLTFAATGTAPPAVELLACPTGDGAGDEVTRAFYHPSYPGTTLKSVTLYLSSNQRASTPTTYGLRLIARSGGFNGPLVGTSNTALVSLRGYASEKEPATFTFAGEPATTKSGIVTFQFEVTTNPTGAKLFFNLGPKDGSSTCPLIETRDARGTLSVVRHQGVAAVISGAR
jgi:hypothetical protein